MKTLLLCVLALLVASFSVACDGDNAAPPGPRGAPSSGIIPVQGITEAQKAEAIQNIGQLKNAVQGLAVQPRYRGKMDQLARDIGGNLTDGTARAMGFAGAAGFNGQWYKSTDYYVNYMGNNKWIVQVKGPGDPAFVSEELVIR